MKKIVIGIILLLLLGISYVFHYTQYPKYSIVPTENSTQEINTNLDMKQLELGYQNLKSGESDCLYQNNIFTTPRKIGYKLYNQYSYLDQISFYIEEYLYITEIDVPNNVKRYIFEEEKTIQINNVTINIDEVIGSEDYEVMFEFYFDGYFFSGDIHWGNGNLLDIYAVEDYFEIFLDYLTNRFLFLS